VLKRALFAPHLLGPLRYCMALRGAGGTQEGSGCTSAWGSLKKKNRKYHNFLDTPSHTQGLFWNSNHVPRPGDWGLFLVP
jgi:hypothetical protein